MKKIDEQKLQAFTTGAMGKRPLSRKELEEIKKKEEEAAAAHAFKEFVETFQEAPSKISKVWVKAGTYDAGSRKEDNREKGKLYKPTSKLEEAEKSSEYVKMLASESKKDALLKKKAQEKKKSNLELFKEELRLNQQEREERQKYKHMARSMLPVQVEPDPIYPKEESGSFDNGDPNTTNLYLGNLNPKISENQLMELFGKFGPLASIKIMWPRSEEEKSRGRNCGFVAYMSRRDAERALKSLNGKDVMGYEMKLGWGKSVPILTHPIYIPPSLVAYSLPPPSSGLPFNAQPHHTDADNIPKMTSKMYMTDPDTKMTMDNILKKSIIKVVIPTERSLIMLIHRMIEFVIREGPMFETLIMTKEMDNPNFRFLFENESPAHIYYRWKLFSLLQGDTANEWRQMEFRMFKDGSVWKPPPVNFYSQGMPEELIGDDDSGEPNKGALSVAQRDRLEDLLRHLTPERQKIGDAMIFCIEHADAADEICECIAESLSSTGTMVRKKIARLYLISDILHNCSVKVQNASFYRKSMEKNLLDMFKSLNSYYMAVDSRLKAEGFKARVMQVLKAWEEWAVYPKDFLCKLQNTFLGLPIVEVKEEEEVEEEKEEEDPDLDGVPLDGAALLKGAFLRGISDNNSRSSLIQDNNEDNDEDIDGMPFDDDIDGIPIDSANYHKGGFVPSKWETVDAAQVEAQAITTSKWESLDPVAPEPPIISKNSDIDSEDDYTESNSREFDDDRRTRLREIEVKLVQYQDELESGRRSVKTGWTLPQQLEHYRRKLLRKFERAKVDSDSPSDAYVSSSSKKGSRKSITPDRKHKRSKRSPSPEYVRNSPSRSKSSRRSRSPYSKSSKQSKRRASPTARSASVSPKRYNLEKSPQPSSRYESSSSKYDSSKYDLTSKYERYEASSSYKYDSSPRRYRSPSPKTRNLSPSSSSRSSSRRATTREYSPSYSKYQRESEPTSSSSRSDKYKKHKY